MALRGGKKKFVVRENLIERAIGDYLLYSGFCFYNQRTRGYFDSVRKTFRKDRSPYALNGLPDYMVFYRGMGCGMEVKTAVGRQSPSQKEFEIYLTKKGGAQYAVVRTLDEAIAVVTRFKERVDKLWVGINKFCDDVN